MNLFDLLKDHAGMSQEEAENYFHIENTATEWTLKSIRYLEPTKFRAVVALAKEYGGNYDATPGVRCIHIPKESVPNPVISEQGIHSEPSHENEKLEEALGHTPPSEPKTICFTVIPITSLSHMTFKSRIAPDFEINELVESIKEHGILEPILVRPKPDGSYELVAGERRVNAAKIAGLTEVPAIVKSLSNVDAIVAQLTENLQRKDLTEEEKSTAVATLKKETGWNVKQIAEHLKKGERWVYKYLPSELKGPEPEQLAKGRIESQESLDSARRALSSKSQDTVKSQDTAQPEIPQRIQRETLNELVECANCHMGFHISKATVVDDKYYCPQHADQAKPPLKQGFTRASSIAKDSWEHRKAQMSPQHSSMEQAILARLSGKALNVMTDFEFCLQKTTPDFWFPDKRIAVYVDGPVHVGREDRDEALRELLRKRHGVNVVTVAYVADTETERERVFNLIMEATKQ
jgi:ParB/RepB/Spo0J family partition protein